MSGSNLKPFLAGLVISAAVFLAIHIYQQGPVSSDGRSASSILGVLYDFQTLAGGILAICAAWWTIATMEKTDQAAALRHEEQLGLSLRADRLAVERAINPQVRSLLTTVAELQVFREQLLQHNTFEDQVSAIIWRCHRGLNIFADIKDTLEREQLRDGSRLFDGMLTYKLRWLHARSAAAVETLGLISEPQAPGLQWEIGRSVYPQVEDIYTDISRFVDEIPTVVSMMVETGERYGVQ